MVNKINDLSLGDQTDKFYVILKGKVSVMKHSKSKKSTSSKQSV